MLTLNAMIWEFYLFGNLNMSNIIPFMCISSNRNPHIYSMEFAYYLDNRNMKFSIKTCEITKYLENFPFGYILFLNGCIIVGIVLKFNCWYIHRRCIRIKLIDVHCRIFWYILEKAIIWIQFDLRKTTIATHKSTLFSLNSL